MDWLVQGFLEAMGWGNLLVALVGCFLGTLVGVLPGLGPTASVALLFPFTAFLTSTQVLIGLGGIYYGAMFGGAITAILLNIPGEVAAVPTALEGYPLARQGRVDKPWSSVSSLRSLEEWLPCSALRSLLQGLPTWLFASDHSNIWH